jgi:ribosomal 50S subunit-recycling heat shock protein
MRLDVFLKNTRLIKRRTAAKDAASGGGVLLNGHAAKAGRDVKAGDVLTILDDEGPELRVRILQEALRPVPKGREPEFFERLDAGGGAP